MRLTILGLSLALTASAPLVATAQAPVTVQPLAQGEVLVEINALGVVTTRADRATLTFSIQGSGDTDADAVRQVEGSVRNLRQELRSLGIADADIRIQPAVARATRGMTDVTDDMSFNGTVAMVEENMADTNAMMSATSFASAAVEITIRNVDRAHEVRAVAIQQSGVTILRSPAYALADDSVPRRQARAQALQKARADAEAYAVALNMRVVRVARVSERLGFDMFGMMISEPRALANLYSPAALRNNGGPDVQTMVTVGVDFVLAPQ